MLYKIFIMTTSLFCKKKAADSQKILFRSWIFLSELYILPYCLFRFVSLATLAWQQNVLFPSLQFIVSAQEVAGGGDSVKLHLAAAGLDKMDTFSKSDPVLVISKLTGWDCSMNYFFQNENLNQVSWHAFAKVQWELLFCHGQVFCDTNCSILLSKHYALLCSMFVKK